MGTPTPVHRSLRGLLIALALLSGCRTTPSLPPLDLSEPGWKVRQGQAVWKLGRGSGEIAGDLLVATHPDGRAFVQFTKTPLAIVTAWISASRWHAQFPPDETIEGFGPPPSRLIWLHLPKFLEGSPPPSRWKWSREEQSWGLENTFSGERLEGFIAP